VATQQTEKISFGTARIYMTPPGGSGQRLRIADVNDVTIDVKVDIKTIFGEGAYPLGAFDGHREIDVAGKHWTLNLETMGFEWGLTYNPPPSGAVIGTVIDEVHTITAHTFTLAPPTPAVAADVLSYSVVVIATLGSGAGAYTKTYDIVASGSEVAGSSCSVTAGVVNFATAETATAASVSYDYMHGTTTQPGSTVHFINTYQNSMNIFTMTLIKRDRSPIDNSVGILRADLYAVRPGGLKLPFKENEAANYERTWKAFADGSGRVMDLTFVNQ
jgi:hypothetical protein